MDSIMDFSYRFRALLAVAVAFALGIGGAALFFGLRAQHQPVPSLYVNANGADVLTHPGRHIEAAVQLRGRVLSSRELGDGALVTVRIDGVPVAAHVYDPTWAPVIGAPLQIDGRVRGALGDPIEACGIPISPPLHRGSTLIDVTEATGPHRARRSGAGAARGGRSGQGC